MTNAPLYRLHDVDLTGDTVTGSLGLAPFAEYALTADLLEGELLDAISHGQPIRPGELPLRSEYLPDLSEVLDLGARKCRGVGPASESTQGSGGIPTADLGHRRGRCSGRAADVRRIPGRQGRPSDRERTQPRSHPLPLGTAAGAEPAPHRGRLAEQHSPSDLGEPALHRLCVLRPLDQARNADRPGRRGRRSCGPVLPVGAGTDRALPRTRSSRGHLG